MTTMMDRCGGSSAAERFFLVVGLVSSFPLPRRHSLDKAKPL